MDMDAPHDSDFGSVGNVGDAASVGNSLAQITADRTNVV
jgi:hypothetical protein